MDISELISPTPQPSQQGMFTCTWDSCGKSFGRRSDLERHYRIHINDRPYACTFSACRKRFIQRSALTVHMRTHTGERPHKCEHPGCSKKFSDSSSLARHRRIHAGKRPYICQYGTCGKSFTKKILLARHTRVEHATVTKVRRTSSAGSEQDACYDGASLSSPSASPFTSPVNNFQYPDYHQQHHLYLPPPSYDMPIPTYYNYSPAAATTTNSTTE